MHMSGMPIATAQLRAVDAFVSARLSELLRQRAAPMVLHDVWLAQTRGRTCRTDGPSTIITVGLGTGEWGCVGEHVCIS